MESGDRGLAQECLVDRAPDTEPQLGSPISGINNAPKPTDTQPYGHLCDPTEWPGWIAKQLIPLGK